MEADVQSSHLEGTSRQPNLVLVMYQTVFQAVQLTEWLFLRLCMRQQSCRLKIILENPFEKFHLGGLH